MIKLTKRSDGWLFGELRGIPDTSGCLMFFVANINVSRVFFALDFHNTPNSEDINSKKSQNNLRRGHVAGMLYESSKVCHSCILMTLCNASNPIMEKIDAVIYAGW